MKKINNGLASVIFYSSFTSMFLILSIIVSPLISDNYWINCGVAGTAVIVSIGWGELMRTNFYYRTEREGNNSERK